MGQATFPVEWLWWTLVPGGCQCGSSNHAKLNPEMVIHFSGLKNLDKPGVWVFSKLLVCLDCGGSQFKIPERELAAVAQESEV